MCREAEHGSDPPLPSPCATKGVARLKRGHRSAEKRPMSTTGAARDGAECCVSARTPQSSQPIGDAMIDLLKSTLFLGAILLAGCASQPQTAEEFRKAVPGAFLAKTETVEVAKPFREVAANFQKRAPECLNVTVETVSQTTTSYQVIVAAYKPTVVVTAERAELHVQQDYKQGV